MNCLRMIPMFYRRPVDLHLYLLARIDSRIVGRKFGKRLPSVLRIGNFRVTFFIEGQSSGLLMCAQMGSRNYCYFF